MKTKLGIRNFRIYNSKGTFFEFSPITILTGRNSSGKSTAVKALVLLKNFFDQARQSLKYGNYIPANYYLDFTYANMKLAGFENVLNKECIEGNDIVFSYTVKPLSSAFVYTVELKFGSRENDRMKYGWLNSIEIYSEEDLLFSAKAHLIPKVQTKAWEALKNGVTGNTGENEGSEFFFIPEFININSILFSSFIRFSACALINTANEDVDKCYDDLGLVVSEEKEKLAKDNLDTIISTIRSTINLDNEDLKDFTILVNNDEITDNYKALFKSSFYEPFMDCIHNSILFYFPILKRFENIKKEEVKLVFDNLFDEYDHSSFLMHPDALDSRIKAIIQDFEASHFDSFIDYYRHLENDFLNNPIEFGKNRRGNLVFRKNNFINGIIYCINLEAGNKKYGSLRANYTPIIKDESGIELLYDAMTCLQDSIDQVNKQEPVHYTLSTDSSGWSSRHTIFEVFTEYIRLLFEEILIPEDFKEIIYLGSTHIAVKRLYSFDEKDPVTSIIRRYISASRDFNEICSFNNNVVKRAQGWPKYLNKQKPSEVSYIPGSFTDFWLSKMGIANHLIIDVDDEGYGAKLKLLKKEGMMRSVADEGFGISQIISLLLRIEGEYLSWKAALMENGIDGQFFDEDFAEPLEIKASTLTLCIEEPEVSLHPNMQSILTDVFIDAYNRFGIHFIVETHSEYIIRRFQSHVARECRSIEDIETLFPVAIYYIDSNETYKMEFRENCSGRFKKSFGEGFLDESSSSNIDILKKEKELNNGRVS